MILPVLQYPDPRLTLKAQAVSEITPKIRTLAADMAETMYARDGVGLAAPQVGESLRLVVMDMTGPDERSDLRVLINPLIVLSGEEVEAEEGCLSVCDYSAKVARREFARVEALDLDGHHQVFDAQGRMAVCVQHECDHLDGVLFIDRLSRLKRGMLDRRLQKKKI
ncbi:MAG: peptide deformylase [Desulfovibrio sp.]|jgi:peptide deformylase|nr:peptide deformylase [Desulfovibrio sp.]